MNEYRFVFVKKNYTINYYSNYIILKRMLESIKLKKQREKKVGRYVYFSRWCILREPKCDIFTTKCITMYV